MRKRESTKLASEKKKLETDRIRRQKRLEFDERRRLLREQRGRLTEIRQERAEQLKKEQQARLRSSFDTRLQKKKKFGIEKVGKPKKKNVGFLGKLGKKVTRRPKRRAGRGGWV